MRNALFALLVALCASGCATSRYGNYSAALPTYDKAMAADTVTHLVKLYPPAQTRWNIGQQADDTYGVALITALRMRGYSVSEYSPETYQDVKPGSEFPLASTHSGIELRYIVDSLAPAVPLYRVTVLLGQKTISRAYMPQQSGTVTAAGSWARME